MHGLDSTATLYVMRHNNTRQSILINPIHPARLNNRALFSIGSVGTV